MKDRIVKMIEERERASNGFARIGVAGCIIGMLLGAVSLLGTMEKTDNDFAVKEYCKGVHEGIHPDYNQSYQRQCKNGEPKQ